MLSDKEKYYMTNLEIKHINDLIKEGKDGFSIAEFTEMIIQKKTIEIKTATAQEIMAEIEKAYTTDCGEDGKWIAFEPEQWQQFKKDHGVQR